VLLEAPRVVIEGDVAALGGAGGQGSPCESPCGDRGAGGASGDPVRVPARAAGTVGSGGGGGRGSDLDGLSGSGLPEVNGGGGGGGAGRIRIHLSPLEPRDYEGHIYPSLASRLSTIGDLPLVP
jgi:hypothetical protein